MESKEIESTAVRSVLKADPNKDVYDMIEEVDNLITHFKDFKAELLEDLCQVAGLYVDRYAMDHYERQQKDKSAN